MNANGCCDASAHRSAILAVDGARLVKFETFAIDWVRLEGKRFYAGDGTRNEDHFAFGAEVLAVAAGTVAFVRDGMPEETPFEPSKSLRQPLDYPELLVGHHSVEQLFEVRVLEALPHLDKLVDQSLAILLGGRQVIFFLDLRLAQDLQVFDLYLEHTAVLVGVSLDVDVLGSFEAVE